MRAGGTTLLLVGIALVGSPALPPGPVGESAGWLLAAQDPDPADRDGSVSTSLGWSSGRWIFDRWSHQMELSTSARIRAGRFGAGISAPLVIGNGGLVVPVGAGWAPTGGRQTGFVAGRIEGESIPTRRRRGGSGGSSALASDTLVFDERWRFRVGDPLLSGGMDLNRMSPEEPFLVTLEGFARVPLHDAESGWSTGEWDFGGGLSGLALLDLGAFASLQLSWWRYGDPPGLELRNGLSGSVVVGFLPEEARWIRSWAVGLSGSQRIVPTAEPPFTLFGSVGWEGEGGASRSISVQAGITEGAPSAGAALSWGWN